MKTANTLKNKYNLTPGDKAPLIARAERSIKQAIENNTPKEQIDILKDYLNFVKYEL